MTDLINLTASIIEAHTTAVVAAWNAGNNAGQGYEIGEDGDDTIAALGASFVTDIGYLTVGVYMGSVIAVGDSSGPWAVDVTAVFAA